jgi:hypothetical protein
MRIGFFLLSAALWLGAMTLIPEAWERAQAPKWAAAGKAWFRTSVEAAAPKNEAVIREYASGPVQEGEDTKARAVFLGLSEVERQAFAAQRNEIVLLCDAQGHIRQAYRPADVAEALARVTGTFLVGKSLPEAMPADLAEDVRAALNQALSLGQQLREYPLPQADVKPYVAQFAFYPYKDTATVAVFIRDSIWDVLWQRFRPHIHQNDAYDVHTNNAGFRGPDVALPKPAGVVRIVCVGGSTTFEGPSDELTYPGILQTKLRRHFGSDAIEVVNGGIIAGTTSQERQRFADYLALQPDCIAHYNLVNDLMYALPRWLDDDPLPLRPVHGLLRRSLFLYRHANAWTLPSSARLLAALKKDTVANVAAMADQARQAGVDFAVCSFAAPLPEHMAWTERAYFDTAIHTMLNHPAINPGTYARMVGWYNESVRTLCRERGLQYIPVAEKLGGGAENFTDICHMHLWSTERKADVVFEAIKDYVAKKLGHTP